MVPIMALFEAWNNRKKTNERRQKTFFEEIDEFPKI